MKFGISRLPQHQAKATQAGDPSRFRATGSCPNRPNTHPPLYNILFIDLLFSLQIRSLIPDPSPALSPFLALSLLLSRSGPAFQPLPSRCSSIAITLCLRVPPTTLSTSPVIPHSWQARASLQRQQRTFRPATASKKTALIDWQPTDITIPSIPACPTDKLTTPQRNPSFRAGRTGLWRWRRIRPGTASRASPTTAPPLPHEPPQLRPARSRSARSSLALRPPPRPKLSGVCSLMTLPPQQPVDACRRAARPYLRCRRCQERMATRCTLRLLPRGGGGSLPPLPEENRTVTLCVSFSVSTLSLDLSHYLYSVPLGLPRSLSMTLSRSLPRAQCQTPSLP